MKIGLLQTAIGNNIQKNLLKAVDYIGQAARQGATVICLPELFAYPYFAQEQNKRHFELAEIIPGNISRFLQRTAREYKVTLVGGSLFEKDDEKIAQEISTNHRDVRYYNTALIVSPQGKITGKYRKVHLPHDQFYYEQFYFSPGDEFVQIESKRAVIAPLICYDQWFPEAARINALKGAQILFYPTAIGWFEELKQSEPFSAQRWEDAMRAHASMNGVYVAAANRVGTEGKLTFWGGSFIADPYGQIVVKASDTKEEVVVAEIDLEKIIQSQEGWGFVKNRRPEVYEKK